MELQDKKRHQTRVFLCKYSIFPFSRPCRCFCFDGNLLMFQKPFLLWQLYWLYVQNLLSARGENRLTILRFRKMLFQSTLHVHFVRYGNGKISKHKLVLLRVNIVGELFTSQFLLGIFIILVILSLILCVDT